MLAQISDTAVLSAILVYALAMIAYAAETAMRSRASATARTAETVRTAVPVAAGGGSTGPAAPAPAVADAAPAVGRGVLRAGRIADGLTVVGFGINLLALVTRGIAAGRAPWGNMYEFALAAALAATFAFLVLLRRHPVRALGPWVLGLSTLSLGLAMTVLYTSAGALVPALNSYWLVIHVAAAIVAGGMFTLGAGLSILLLVRARHDRRVDDDPSRVGRRGFVGQLPSSASLQSLSQAVHVFAFPIWTFAVIAGAIWAEESWGRYWGWDPKETWAFVTWVLYAAYLHAQSTAGWRGARASWFAVSGYLAFLFNFFGVNIWIPSLHSYAGV